jgi:hypothetical protein
MYRFEARSGVLDHLTSKDCVELYAILMAMTAMRPPSQRVMIEAIKACLCNGKPDPWFVVHDEDMVALHRHDDEKPVVMFVTKEDA